MKYSGLKPHGTIPNAYTNATKGLQNYGANIRKNIIQGQANLKSGKANYYGSINPFPNPFKSSSYQ